MTPKEKLEQIHTNDLEAKGEITALLQYANGVTGEQDTRIGDAVYRLAAGYGQGGGGGWRPETVEYLTAGFPNQGYMLASDGSITQRASAATTDMMSIPTKAEYLEFKTQANISAGVRVVFYKNGTPVHDETILDGNIRTIAVANMSGFRVGAGIIATTKTVTITYVYKED